MLKRVLPKMLQLLATTNLASMLEAAEASAQSSSHKEGRFGQGTQLSLDTEG